MELLDFYKGKRVLVTGDTGFKGSWLVRILHLAGAEVTGYALKAPTEPSMFEILHLRETIHHVDGDVRDFAHLKQVFDETKPEIVLHLAAQPIVRESYRDPVGTYAANVMGTVHVLECARQCESVRSLVNVTTDKVYENKEWEYGYRENDPLDGYDPYSNSKSCSELVTHSYKQSFFTDGRCAVSTCRAGNVIGGGDFAADRSLTIKEQLSAAKEKVASKSSCEHFIAYFQAFTNTYAPVDYLRRIFYEAIEDPSVAVLSIGTRTDCFSTEIYDLLSELNKIKPVWVELGLQTIHRSTLDAMNTHTCVEDFIIVTDELRRRGIKVIAHLILGLPHETRGMMLESVNFVAKSGIFGVKLQLLHVLKGTPLADMYIKQPFELFTLDDYCDFVVDCIERLPKDMVIHRMTGDGPRSLLVAPLWSTDKKRVLNTINKKFEVRDTYQGRLNLF